MEVKEVKEHKKDARRFASSALERGPDWIFLYFIHLLYFLNLMSLQNKKAGRRALPAGQIILLLQTPAFATLEAWGPFGP